jgi:hypothetical protein
LYRYNASGRHDARGGWQGEEVRKDSETGADFAKEIAASSEGSIGSIFSICKRNIIRRLMSAEQIKDQIRKTNRIDEIDWYAYRGPLGQVLHYERYFFAWKDRQILGTYKTLEEAMECLIRRD